LTFRDQAPGRLSSLVSFSILVFICLAFTTALPRSHKHQYVIADESSNGTNVKIRSSEVLLIDLPEQPGTGYGWQALKFDRGMWKMDKLDDEEVESLRKSGILPAHALPKGRFGATEWAVFRLKPRKLGTTEIQLVYVRPWQPETPGKSFTLKVTTNE
jgi:predicted secreted protein